MESTHQNTAIDAELSSLQRDRDVHLEQVKLIDAQIAILRKVRGQDAPKSGSNGHSQGVIFSSLVPESLPHRSDSQITRKEPRWPYRAGSD